MVQHRIVESLSGTGFRIAAILLSLRVHALLLSLYIVSCGLRGAALCLVFGCHFMRYGPSQRQILPEGNCRENAETSNLFKRGTNEVTLTIASKYS